MKKIFKRVLAGIGALITLLITVMIVKFYVLSPKMRPAPVMTTTLPRRPLLIVETTNCLRQSGAINRSRPQHP